MIGSLKGQIVLKKENFVILEVSGVGYKIFISPYTLRTIGEDSKVTLFTHHHPREDIEDLYGFANYDELEFFEMLLKVSGIGPKAALSVLGIGSLQKIKQAIINNDPSTFTAVSGVGKKAATKIIIELKNKISEGEADLSFLLEEHNEVADALLNLGYKREQISKTLHNLPKDIKETKDQIRWALKNIR